MFADNIVICSERREKVEENLQRWRYALERKGMKVSHRKTDYLRKSSKWNSEVTGSKGGKVPSV